MRILRILWNLRNHPATWFAIGVVVTNVFGGAIVMLLLLTGGSKAVPDHAGLIGALVALGGVLTAQMVSIALEAQRARQAALQNYFEDVGKVLIEQPLLRARPGDDLSTVVRAKTLSVLETLDPGNKRALLQFLHEAGLIDYREPVVYLKSANLSNAHLRKAILTGAYLRESNLNGADLRGAYLGSANLYWAELNGADLREANLYDTDVRGTFLSGADLRGASLNGADLRGAFLLKANLKGAVGITNEELEQQVGELLEGATMPNGQKYEDWLKSKRGGEDGENE